MPSPLFDLGRPLLWAEAGAAAAPAGSQSMFIFYLVGLGLLFFFVILRPEQKRRKQHQEMLTSLKKGDQVITTAGIYASIVRIDEEKQVIVLALDDGKMKVRRDAVATRIETEKDKDKPKDADKGDDRENRPDPQ